MTNINQEIGKQERSFSSSIYPSKIENAFWNFHRENPRIWVLFSRFTNELIARGYTHYSADAIMHRVRWETNVETRGDIFKINNNHVAYYARLFYQVNPQYKGFFRTRKVKS